MSEKRRSPMSTETEQRLIDMVKDGRNAREIAETLNLGGSGVRQRISVLRERGILPAVTAKARRTRPVASATEPRPVVDHVAAPTAKGTPGRKPDPDALRNRPGIELQCVYLDHTLRARTKAVAALAGVTVSALIAEALREYLDRHGPKL